MHGGEGQPTVASDLEATASPFLVTGLRSGCFNNPRMEALTSFSFPVGRKEDIIVKRGSLSCIKTLGVRIQNTAQFLKCIREEACTIIYA